MLGPDYFQSAFPVARLHTTGVDDNGLPRTDGLVDPNWAITSTPQAQQQWHDILKARIDQETSYGSPKLRSGVISTASTKSAQ
jgi:hypothetical protein